MGRGARRVAIVAIALLSAPFALLLSGSPAGAIAVGDEATFRTEFANAAQTQIDLTADITLTCTVNPNDAAVRSSATALVIDGHGFVITQSCPGSGVLENLGAGTLTLHDVTLTGGTKTQSSGAVINGGGVYSLSTLTLEGVTLTGNTVSGNPGGNGGGAAGDGAVFVRDSLITGNTAEKNGGGIQGANLASLDIARSSITGNHATTQGGGGFAGGAQAITLIVDSEISGNQALAGNGAGGFLGVGPNLVSGTTIAANSGGGTGGGLQIGGATDIVNSTISGNLGATSGGGIELLVTVRLEYVTLSSNTSFTGANLHVNQQFGGAVNSFGTVVADPHGGGANCVINGASPTVSAGYNFEEATDTCGFGAGAGDVVDGPDPLLGALGDNGGLTPTRLPGAGSPLLDQIPAAACPGQMLTTTDQRGVTRPQGAGCDIGAVEVEPPIPAASPLIVRFAG